MPGKKKGMVKEIEIMNESRIIIMSRVNRLIEN
ncbi:hypothetical protein J2743_002193 [Methanobacterium petrolearium]|nr:hypothetical protein [Methanobacterium petrolearium]